MQFCKAWIYHFGFYGKQLQPLAWGVFSRSGCATKTPLLLTFSIRYALQELVNTSEEIKLRMINTTGRAQVWKLYSSGIRFKFPATSGDAGWQKNTIMMIGLIRASVLKHTRCTTLRRGDNQRGAAVLMSILLYEAFVQGGISLSCSHWKECMLQCMILHIPSGLRDRVIMKHIP